MPNQPKTPARGIRLPDTTWEALQREAEAKQQTPSELVRAILGRHVKRQNC
jgi:predicted transcriptional regulator